MINFKMLDIDSDTKFIKECMKNEIYQEFIGYNVELNNRIIYILTINKKEIGFFELYNVDKYNKNLSFNIFMVKHSSPINAIAMFESIRFIFEELNYHKIIIKVKSKNANMINILNSLEVPLEGIVKRGIKINDDEFQDMYFFRLLYNEYNSIKVKVKERFK